MKNTQLSLVAVVLTLFSFQAGCRSRVFPISGAVEMEQEQRQEQEKTAQPPSEQNPRRRTENHQLEDDFFGSSDGLLEEEIGRKAQTNANRRKTRARGGKSSTDFGDIFFQYSLAVLEVPSQKILRDNAKKLLRNPRARVRISGHTDDRGSNEFNLALGERRARTVKKFLEAFGIVSKRIEIISYGEEKPLCNERDELCWKKNRRVHFSLKPHK